MYLLPAIDILDGRAVRLERGDYSRVTVYHDDPALQAQLFEEQGAEWIHVVDLDGARSGDAANIDVVTAILRRTQLHVEVGGGIRTLDTARRILDTGADRVILGTALVRDPDFAQAAIEEFGPDAVVCGIDAKDGDVKVEGWVQGAEISALELASRMATLGYEHLVYTDIARDGMQTGVDPEAYRAVAAACGFPVTASGGVTTVEDVRRLAALGDGVVEGVVCGRALYEGTLDLAEALAAKGVTVDRKAIAVEAIKTVGEYIATAKLHREVKAEIKFSVVAAEE